jgi:hypothetical protein
MPRPRKGEPATSVPDIVRKILAVNRATTAELKEELRRLTGQESKTFNRPYLLRRVAFLIQAQARRGHDAGDAPDSQSLPAPGPLPVRDRRLPSPGSEIVKTYKGHEIRVRITEGGFECFGASFPTLTAVAKVVTGQRFINGYLFFGLVKRKRAK